MKLISLLLLLFYRNNYFLVYRAQEVDCPQLPQGQKIRVHHSQVPQYSHSKEHTVRKRHFI